MSWLLVNPCGASHRAAYKSVRAGEQHSLNLGSPGVEHAISPTYVCRHCLGKKRLLLKAVAKHQEQVIRDWGFL